MNAASTREPIADRAPAPLPLSYYKANQLRVAAKWTRRVGYTLLPIILFIGVAAGHGDPEGLSILMRGALLAAIVLGISELAGFLIEKAADRMAKR